MNQKITIIGGGLAGCEAAYQALQKGYEVTLWEMRPKVSSKAHKTSNLAELVCSNSFKSFDEHSASGILKLEMKDMDSLIIKSAYAAKVPAGKALAVDREIFSEKIKTTLQSFPKFTKKTDEIISIPSIEELENNNEIWIVATGPLTTEPLAEAILDLCEENDKNRMYFYDAIAPILNSDSINLDEVFRQDRYGELNQGDYLNIPLDREEYYTFIEDILNGEKSPLHSFETTKYFESCLPIEVMAERGKDTLRFGPMKPVGLVDPKTGFRPYAAIQMRIENQQESMFSMVGFQTKLTWGEQKRIFSKLKGLQNLEFFRYGSIHRNTYVNSPKVLNTDLSLKNHPRVYLAGQITGVEGYLESTAIGLLASLFADAKHKNSDFQSPPADTMIGALYHYITTGLKENFQPMNTNFGILQSTKPLPKKTAKKQRKIIASENARYSFSQFWNNSQTAGL